ncbi:hypothetical protein [Salipiger abyssi]|nr:hypothetical protein [Salipiger abyssi]
MTERPSGMQEILAARLEITQEISAATAEHLRLTQRLSGFEVLRMGGEETREDAEGMARDRAALRRCEEEIEQLETRMAGLDAELERKAGGEGQ